MTGFVLMSVLVPFAVLGVLLGHLLTVDSMGPGDGRHHGAVRAARRGMGSAGQPPACCTTSLSWLPSYWLVQAGQSAVDGVKWGGPLAGWLVILVWTCGADPASPCTSTGAAPGSGVRLRADTPPAACRSRGLP